MYGIRSIVMPVVLFAILVGGCRRVYTFVPIEGTVYQSNKPLSGAQVVFFTDPESGTEGPRSWGITDSTGHYCLQTDHGDIGAVVGRHRVCITLLAPQEKLAERFHPSTASLLEPADGASLKKNLDPKMPAIYGNIHDTPLRAEVRHGGTQTFDFNIP